MGDRPEVGRLVRASADGDEEAWNELVRRFGHRVMAVIRSYRLSPADAEDVCQTVWLRLVEHLDSLRDPRPARLAAQSPRCTNVMRQTERRQRTVPVDPQSDEAVNRPAAEDIEAAAVRAELRLALRDGLAELAEEDQALLRAYALAEPYKNVSELLQMKTGSIGPTLAAQPGHGCGRPMPCVRTWAPGQPPRIRKAVIGLSSPRWTDDEWSDDDSCASYVMRCRSHPWTRGIFVPPQAAFTWRTVDADLEILSLETGLATSDTAQVRGSRAGLTAACTPSMASG